MKTRVIFLFVLFLSVTSLMAQKAPPSADEIMKDAYAIAKKENKKVLLMFHASWCGWCHKMDTSLNDPSVKKVFQ